MNTVWPRREFLKALTVAGSVAAGFPLSALGREKLLSSADLASLPMGDSPQPVFFPHFPSRLHAFVWRNWQLVPVERMARAVGARKSDIQALAAAMGLGKQPRISRDQQRRSYITVIKRNWHLLPYEQLLALLDWTPEELAFTLREDDFLYIKLGSRKPKCEPLVFTQSDVATRGREEEIARFVREQFPRGILHQADPLFSFVEELSGRASSSVTVSSNSGGLRFCYSYFALYGDPLLDGSADPYPDGLLARLANNGVNGVWLQAVLHKLAPCPWDPSRSARYQERLKNLGKLVARARRRGIKVFLYLNEPRALPLSFFAQRTELKGVTQGDHATLCTSQSSVREFLRNSVAMISRAVPDLGGFFTITASENLTHCWSHGGGKQCPRCSQRSPAEVIAEVNASFHAGIQAASGKQRLLAWDWGWNDAWSADAIARLPAGVSLMSVSEWNLPIERGGVKSAVGEYSISSVGPGPRAKRHWRLARERGLSIVAKIQTGNTWELSSVPYIPAVSLVAEHARNLRAEGVNDLMLGWTLGGHPSPNLQAIQAVMSGGELSDVAERWFGESLGAAVLRAWTACGEAFREFPYHIGVVYSAPLQTGPANLLWSKPTGFSATMVGFPYDDVDQWRSIYPAQVFMQQLERVADGFLKAASDLTTAIDTGDARARRSAELLWADREVQYMTAAALHWRSAANQTRFTLARREPGKKDMAEPFRWRDIVERILNDELSVARQLLDLQKRDSRIGFEASNHYYYVPFDLVEKMLNCRHLLDEWLPAQRARLMEHRP